MHNSRTGFTATRASDMIIELTHMYETCSALKLVSFYACPVLIRISESRSLHQAFVENGPHKPPPHTISVCSPKTRRLVSYPRLRNKRIRP